MEKSNSDKLDKLTQENQQLNQSTLRGFNNEC